MALHPAGFEAHAPRTFAYESMGTHWAVTVWDAADGDACAALEREVVEASHAFDSTYSRFIASSLVWELAECTGQAEVPRDLVSMLRLYMRFNALSGGKCNPLIGHSISDLGYDAVYTLRRKETVRPTPKLVDAVEILDDTHILLREKVLIDVGALGKGFFVDRIASMLRARGYTHFLVDGSGDIFYQGPVSIRAGLEDPRDASRVVGAVTFAGGGLCASGTNRRAWGDMHHIIDPDTLEPARDIVATWALAQSASVADGLATCLFFVDPKRLEAAYPFEYCIMRADGTATMSPGFPGEVYTGGR